ncbi:MAG: hypothetical protein PHW47_12675 [Lachnospira sp.]|nr:hypothetical protein [Lachnospira sp.]
MKYNPTIDWMIFTDDHGEYPWPSNVIVHYCTFEDFKEMIQRKFEFPITLTKPYRLTDFKPAYGYVLQEYISEYEFWGHCDFDVIWGGFYQSILTMMC